MKWLNYHHLYYFRSIAQAGGVAKASRVLRVGQPALSVQLKQLEEAVGHPLFERRGKSLILTEAGKVTLKYAENIFRTGEELLQVLSSEAFSDRVEVRIGALDSVPKQVLYELFATTLEMGGASVTLLEDNSDVLFTDLFAHRLDIVVTNHLPVLDGGTRIYSRLLARVPVSVYGTKKFAHLKKGFPQSLAGQPLIAPTPHSKLRHDMDHFFDANNIPVQVIGQTQDTGLQRLLGIRGMGLVALADFTTRELVTAEKLVKLGTLKGVTEELWLVSPERTIKNPLAAKIMKDYSLKSLVAPVKARRKKP